MTYLAISHIWPTFAQTYITTTYIYPSAGPCPNRAQKTKSIISSHYYSSYLIPHLLFLQHIVIMEWSKKTYNDQYEKWVPWLEDQYLYYFGKDNKASYVAKGMSSFYYCSDVGDEYFESP
jgi:hypothetical protein